MLEIKCFKVGGLGTNCYLIKDDKTAEMAIIDSGGISIGIDNEIKQNPGKFKYIILTHGHFDHIRKVRRYKDLTGAKVVMNKNEVAFVTDSSLNLSYDFRGKAIEKFKVDTYLNDGETFMLGNTKIKVISTPGHTCGGACYIAENYLFTGDTLMKGTIGRMDFKTGSIGDMKKSLKKLGSLEQDYIICPGHGEMSTLQYEKKHNMYLKKYMVQFSSEQ